eukprot:COSAG02_NODE_8231_length_2650_cov_1.588005_2_plen_269_part_01
MVRTAKPPTATRPVTFAPPLIPKPLLTSAVSPTATFDPTCSPPTNVLGPDCQTLPPATRTRPDTVSPAFTAEGPAIPAPPAFTVTPELTCILPSIRAPPAYTSAPSINWVAPATDNPPETSAPLFPAKLPSGPTVAPTRPSAVCVRSGCAPYFARMFTEWVGKASFRRTCPASTRSGLGDSATSPGWAVVRPPAIPAPSAAVIPPFMTTEPPTTDAVPFIEAPPPATRPVPSMVAFPLATVRTLLDRNSPLWTLRPSLATVTAPCNTAL